MEEILIKKFRSGTTVTYFDTLFKDPSIEYNPAYVILDNFNQPVSLNTFNGVSLWSRDQNNNYVSLDSVTTNYITGNSFSRSSDFELSAKEKTKLNDKFAAKMSFLFSGQSINYVFFKNEL